MNKIKNKKALVITVCVVAVIAVAALVLGFTLGGSKDPIKTPDGTGSANVETAKTPDVSGGDDTSALPSDSTDKTETDKLDTTSNGETADTPAGSEDQTSASSDNSETAPGADTGDVAEVTTGTPEDTTGRVEDTTAAPEVPDDGENTAEDTEEDKPSVVTLPEPEVIVTEGPVENGDSSPWPSDQLPSDIPEFKNIIRIYTCTFQQNDDVQGWYMSWDAKQSDYENWMKEITAANFYPSSNIAGFYGNGKIILDITTEENEDGTTWVSLDVYLSETTWLPSDIAGIYPAIDTTATVYYALDSGSTFDIHYQCAKDWESDLNGYIEKLYDNGFELSFGKAVKTVGGKTYTVTWGSEGIEHETLCFSYGE